MYNYIYICLYDGLDCKIRQLTWIRQTATTTLLRFICLTCGILFDPLVAQIWGQTVLTAASWIQMYMTRSRSQQPQQPMAILLNIRICITQAVQGKMAATVPPVFRVSSRWRASVPARLPQSIPDPIQMQRCREHNASHNWLHVTGGTHITHAVLVEIRKGWQQLCLVHQQRSRVSRKRKACTVAAICLCPPMLQSPL